MVFVVFMGKVYSKVWSELHSKHILSLTSDSTNIYTGIHPPTTLPIVFIATTYWYFFTEAVDSQTFSLPFSRVGVALNPRNLKCAIELTNIVADSRYWLYENFSNNSEWSLLDYLQVMRQAVLAEVENGELDPFRIIMALWSCFVFVLCVCCLVVVTGLLPMNYLGDLFGCWWQRCFCSDMKKMQKNGVWMNNIIVLAINKTPGRSFNCESRTQIYAFYCWMEYCRFWVTMTNSFFPYEEALFTHTDFLILTFPHLQF